MKSINKGFTLIELLVVIAIIGILSAVVLASLNTARTKGADAAIQSNLSTIQTQAEIYYGDSSNLYDSSPHSSCSAGVFAQSSIAKAITGIEINNGTSNVVCNSTRTAYAISTPLVAKVGKYWCTDSTGFIGQKDSALGASTVCL
jgi:prepilin-type N-terminal cleavage/methylation domain-containing protein